MANTCNLAWPGDHSELYGHDTRDRLRSFGRGTLNAEGTAITTPLNDAVLPSAQAWTDLDKRGNWLDSSVTLNGTTTPQTRTVNAANEYLTIDPNGGNPPPAVTLAHDDDGNLLTDGGLTYEWDGENRLKSAAPTSPVQTDKQVKFAYDYMNRRVRKQVFGRNGDNSAWLTTPETDLRFVYDQWNVILVLDGNASNAIKTRYTWGLDLSGTIHGAGGIGGLLAGEEPQAVGDPKCYWFFYDGNGNVTQVLDATNVAKGS